MTMTLMTNIVLAAFAALLLWAAVGDWRRFLIPNRISLALVALWPLWGLAVQAGGGDVPWLAGPLCAAAVLVAGLVMFSLGAMGGGDVKLMTGVALWAGPGQFVPFLLVTVVAGVLLALVSALRTGVSAGQGRPRGGAAALVSGFINLRHVPVSGLTVPYGVAIAAGGLWVAGSLAVA